MGSFTSKKKSKPCHERRYAKSLTDKMRLLQEEIKEMVCEREKEARGYEKEVMVFAFKEVEWKKERKKLKEEVKKLRKLVEEKEEKIRGMEDYAVMVEKCDKGWPLLGTSFLLEQMKEERARRDEAVEKWKQLYLAIKTELDDLIQRTHGDAPYWKVEEEEIIEELKKEVKSKEETIEALKTRLASMERQGYERQRELDILRQSLKILGNKKKAAAYYTTNNSKTTTLPRYF